MPATYEPIATTTLGSAASTITFNSIGSTYTDLRLIFIIASQSTASDSPFLRFNSDTGSNYSYTWLAGQGSVAASTASPNVTNIPFLVYTAPSTTLPTFFAIDIFSYAGSTNKTCLISTQNDKNGSGSTERGVGLWRNTSAITSITLQAPSTYTWGVGTTATLFGIKAA